MRDAKGDAIITSFLRSVGGVGQRQETNHIKLSTGLSRPEEEQDDSDV